MVRIEVLCISSFQHNRSSYSKSQAGEVFRDHDYTILLPPNILTLPSKRSATQPLYLKMKSLAVHLSRKASEIQTFQRKLQMLSQIRGEQPPEVDTNQFSGDGLFMQLQGTRIPILQM